MVRSKKKESQSDGPSWSRINGEIIPPRLPQLPEEKILFENCSSPEELYEALDGPNLITLYSKAQRLFQNQRTVAANDVWRVVYVQAYYCAKRLCKANPEHLSEPPNMRGHPVEGNARPGIQDIQAWAFKQSGKTKKAKDDAGAYPPNDAYILFGKAIDFSNGILTRKKLERAITHGEPVKVRSKKPSKQRCEVHIQDVLALIKKLSSGEEVTEQAIELFGRWKKEEQKKKNAEINLD